MRAVFVAVNGVTALFSIILLISAPSLWAQGISNAGLVSIESLDTGEYQKRLSVRVGFTMEHLLVKPNTQLNNLHIVNNDGEAVEQTGTAYTGIVESLPNSWVRVVIDENFIAGTIHAHGNTTHFTSESTAELTARSVLAEPVIPPPESIDTLVLRRTTLNEVEEISVPVSERLTATVGDVNRVISIGVVVDSLYQEALGGRGLSNAISTINSVDGLYRENFGLALKVDVVVLVMDESFLAVDELSAIDGDRSSLKDHLDLFREYRINSELLPDDLGLVHLFTGVQSDDQAIGLAFSGAACRTDGHDVSMARPFLFPVLLTAHEIGHNLGADHDDTTD